MATAQDSDKPHHFIELQTGPWEGRGSWLYRIRCLEKDCGYVDYASSFDDAAEARDEHKKVLGIAPLASRRRSSSSTTEDEWEDF